MRHGRLDGVEVSLTLRNLAQMKFGKMLAAFKLFAARPAFPDLLEQQVPLRSVAIAARRFGSVIAERVRGEGPSFEVPLPRLTVRSADPFPESLEQTGDGLMAIDCRQQLEADSI